MNTRTVIFLSTITFLMMGCSHSSIDSRKMSSLGKEDRINSKNSTSYLTDKDIFGNETTLAVSEEDIQAALRGGKVRVPLYSPVILVQSGNRAPEAIMQQEMSKYYTIATFSGIPDRQKPVFCGNDRNKDTNENQDIAVVENTNWMQALRYVAAKGHQKAIIVYQDTLQLGKYDPVTKNINWSDYKNEQLTGTDSLRYLVRFTLVEVATGEWATWSPANDEYSVLPPLPGRNGINTVETTEQQIAQLKQNTYAAMVKDLVNRYQ